MTVFQYGCPSEIPTTFNPNPEQSAPAGQQLRLRCAFFLYFPTCLAAHLLASTR